MQSVLFILAVGFAAGLLLMHLKVPGGMMVGAIAAVTAVNLLLGPFQLPYGIKLSAQCMAGAFIGCSADTESLRQLPKIWKPTAIVVGALLILNILLGYIFARISPMDPLTAMLSAVPGGMSDIPIIAADMGADAGKVAVLQFLRMSFGVGVFPSLIALMTGKEKQSAPQKQTGKGAAKKTPVGKFLVTLAVSFGAGYLGRLSGIPAGTLLFSMLAVMALKLVFGYAYMPLWAKRIAQVLAGSYIGCGITPDGVAELRYLLLPAVLLLLGYFLCAVVVGRLLHKLLHIPLTEAMLMATPAGASDMALISSDLGVSDPTLIELQIIRMLTAIAVFPQILRLIAAWL